MTRIRAKNSPFCYDALSWFGTDSVRKISEQADSAVPAVPYSAGIVRLASAAMPPAPAQACLEETIVSELVGFYSGFEFELDFFALLSAALPCSENRARSVGSF